jgi:hypothetical protein
MAQTIPSEGPWEEIEGVDPGNGNVVADCEVGEVLNLPVTGSNAKTISLFDGPET